MTPVFCCGFECGVSNISLHFVLNSNTAFDTGTVRSGIRSLRVNPTAATGSATRIFSSSTAFIARCYIRFATLPNANCGLVCISEAGGQFVGAWFKVSDSKIYPGRSAGPTFGATGFTVTTGVWYRIDVRVMVNNNPWTIDVSVDGTELTQLTNAVGSSSYTTINVGQTAFTNTSDVYYDDFIMSQTFADYPLGAGYVNHFIPTSDGTHNVAGANDFERSATGTDITNATTTAYQLIDDVPLKSGIVSEYINLIAPPNATDYVEVVFGPASGIPTPTAAPRAVEAMVAYASASAGTNNLRLALNDNGSLDDVLNTTAGPGTSATYARKHYADPPSAASTWTLAGDGNFNNVRMRCFTSDAAPDPWWASAMIEAEFQEIVIIPNKIFQVKQAVNRASTY